MQPTTIQDLSTELVQAVFHDYVHGGSPRHPVTKLKVGLDKLNKKAARNIMPVPLQPPCLSTYGTPGRSPLLLGQVCSRWRTISHSSPTLWSTIYMKEPMKDSDCRMFESWIARSGNASLDLTLLEEWGDSPVFTAILKAAFGQSQRWKRVVLELNDLKWQNTLPLSLASLWTSRQLEFPVLEYVDVQFGAVDAAPLYARMCTSPVLKEITLPRDCFEPTTRMVTHIPFQRLESITIQSANTKELLEMLKECRAIESLKVRELLHPDGYTQDRNVVVPTLRELELSEVQGGPHVLKFFDLPALKGLFVKRKSTHMAWLSPFTISGDNETWDIIAGLGDRSQLRLDRASFSGGFKESETDEGIARIIPLQMFASLRCLIIEQEVTDTLLSALAFTGSSRPLPCLEAALFTRCHPTPGMLSRMVLSRKEDGYCRLGFLRVRLYGDDLQVLAKECTELQDRMHSRMILDFSVDDPRIVMSLPSWKE